MFKVDCCADRSLAINTSDSQLTLNSTTYPVRPSSHYSISPSYYYLNVYMTPLQMQKLSAARFNYRQLHGQLKATISGLGSVIAEFILWRPEVFRVDFRIYFDQSHPRFTSYEEIVTNTTLSFDDVAHIELLKEYLNLLIDPEQSWIRRDLEIWMSDRRQLERRREEVAERGHTWEAREERLQFRMPFWNAHRNWEETCRGIWAMLQRKAQQEGKQVVLREKECDRAGLRRVLRRQMDGEGF
ncbi:hypothetical protein BDD12DRAFT_920394 [Trichophaea hybrida]|nr:hypothetical protein BDD12DRAFT_920394 [Trichophaea hybrida]